MKNMKIGENILALRHRRGITQEELADFLGVTKASVSKWEKGLSFPDILLLPKIASYFDMSIDKLLGYEAQLDTEEIRRAYSAFAQAFAKEPFEKVMEETENYVKEYYSCYPLCLQMAILWLNHYMLSPDEKRQKQILDSIEELCQHIQENCLDVGMCSDAAVLKAIVQLQTGKLQEVIQLLEPLNDPRRLSSHMCNQSCSVLIQAYEKSGQRKKAVEYSELAIYLQIFTLAAQNTQYLLLTMDDREKGEETIKRTMVMMDAYQLEKLNPNVTLQFHYACALFYCRHREPAKALEHLRTFVEGGLRLMKKGISLHGDDYFDHMEANIHKLDLSGQPPRDLKFIRESLRQALADPALEQLFNTPEYGVLLKSVDN